MYDHRKIGVSTYLNEVEDIRRNWSWFFALGILLVILGIAVMSSSFFATVFSVVLFGLFLMGAGIVQVVQAFLARQWKGLFLSLLLGVLYLVVGFLCISRPAVTAINLTLWIAALCFVIGLFRMIYALLLRFDQWGWVFFNGLVTFILGLLIYSDWPFSGLWVIGLFIGIDLLLSGWSWILLSLSARSRLR